MKIRVVNDNPLSFLIKEELNGFINEITTDVAYNKFYSNIDKNIYDQLEAITHPHKWLTLKVKK